MHIESGYPDSGHPMLGEDNLPNPWQDSRIQLIQNAFNPVAAIDTDFWNANKLSNEAGTWPTTPATLAPGRSLPALSLFNDTLDGDDVNLDWSLRLRARPQAPPIDQRAARRAPSRSAPSSQRSITFEAPSHRTRKLCTLDLKVEQARRRPPLPGRRRPYSTVRRPRPLRSPAGQKPSCRVRALWSSAARHRRQLVGRRGSLRSVSRAGASR